MASTGVVQDRLPPASMGVNVDGLPWWESSAERSAQLALVSRSGFTVVRSVLDWKVVEPAAPANGTHQWQFDAYDKWVLDLNAQGLSWAPVLAFSPDWATSNRYANDPGTGRPDPKFAPPADTGAFAAFVAEVVHRYGPSGSLWASQPVAPERRTPILTVEIWNEPNTYGFWQSNGGPDAARYAQLLGASLRTAVAVDPSITVVSGGLAAIDDTQYWAVGSRKFVQDRAFLEGMLEADPTLAASPHLGIAYHPYGKDADDVARRVEAFRVTARAAGGGSLPMYVNELGWAAPNEGTHMSDDHFTAMSDAERAVQMRRTAYELVPSACGVRQFMAYTWVARESGNASVDWMGLTRRSTEPRGTLNETGTALAEAARDLRATGGRPTARCGTGS
jgi:hypothetical protein